MTVLWGRVVSVALLLALAGSAAAATPRSTRFLVTIAPFAHGHLSTRGSVDVIARSGQVERVVAPAGAPYPYAARWSPDATLIAWAARDGIHVENADGGAQRLLVARVDLVHWVVHDPRVHLVARQPRARCRRRGRADERAPARPGRRQRFADARARPLRQPLQPGVLDSGRRLTRLRRHHRKPRGDSRRHARYGTDAHRLFDAEHAGAASRLLAEPPLPRRDQRPHAVPAAAANRRQHDAQDPRRQERQPDELPRVVARLAHARRRRERLARRHDQRVERPCAPDRPRAECLTGAGTASYSSFAAPTTRCGRVAAVGPSGSSSPRRRAST